MLHRKDLDKPVTRCRKGSLGYGRVIEEPVGVIADQTLELESRVKRSDTLDSNSRAIILRQ